jgi:hypothetical protein
MGKRGLKFANSNRNNKSPTSRNIINATSSRTERGRPSDYKLHFNYHINRNNNELPLINEKQASKRNNDPKGPLRIYHQIIRRIKGKINERMIHLSKMTLDIICLTEHHLNESEIEVTYLPNYKLGAKFCRKKMKN